MSTPAKADKHPIKKVTVYNIQDGYTSIDYGRNESKRVRCEREAKKTRRQLVEDQVADRRKAAREKFSKPREKAE